MFCPYCGQKVGDNDNFCTQCGKRLPKLEDVAKVPEPVLEPQQVAPQPAAPQQPAPQPVAPAPQPTPEPTLRPETPAEAPQRVAAPQPAPVSIPAPAPQQADGPDAESLPRKKRARRRERIAQPWGSRATLALNLVATLLLLATAAIAVFAPLASVPFFSGSAAPAATVQSVLVAMDPGLSVVASGLLGSGDLDAVELAELGIAVADALGNGAAALVVGVVAGLAACSTLMCVLGALSSLLCRRATPMAIAGGFVAAAVGASAYAAGLVANGAAVAWLRNGLSMTLAEMGVQLPQSMQVVATTPWLVAGTVVAALAFACAAWSRSRWRREHPTWR